jgi:hypothetical protein
MRYTENMATKTLFNVEDLVLDYFKDPENWQILEVRKK